MLIQERKKLIWLILVVLSALMMAQVVSADDTQAAESDEGRIVGGVEATPGEFPWMVSVQGGNSHFCGASLIAPEWVLTAAHCVIGESPSRVTIVVGRHDLGTNAGQRRNVSQIIMHPNYNDNTLVNDVALLKLSTPVNGVTPIALVSADMNVDAPNRNATISGWGATSEGGSGSDVLLKVTVPIVTNANCNQSYGGDITNVMVCAGLQQGGKDSCQGDSGGPMMVRNANNTGWLQAGIVSWGQGCAQAGFYGVYARVSALKGWIDAQVGDDIDPEPTPDPTPDPTVTPVPTPDPEPTPDPTPDPDPEPDQYIEITGTVEAITVDTITVDGVEFVVDEYTEVYDDIFEGDSVFVWGEMIEGIYFANMIVLLEEGGDNGDEGESFEFEWTGTVVAIDDTSITVGDDWSGYDETDTFDITADTVIDGNPQVDDFVYIYASYTSDSNGETLIALYIEVLDDGGDDGDEGPEYDWFEGTVTAVSDSELTLEDSYYDESVTVALAADTEFDGTPMVGDLVYVLAVYETDGSLTAESVYVYADEPQETAVKGIVTAISDTSISVDGEQISRRAMYTFAINDATWVQELPEVGDEVIVQGGDVDGVLTAFTIDLVEEQPTEFFEVVGTVEAISAESYTISGETYLIDEDTNISGDPQVGDSVYVWGAETNAGKLAYVIAAQDVDTSFELEGNVDAFDDASVTIDGTVITINESTSIAGTLVVGAEAFVTGYADGETLVAESILVIEDDAGDAIEFVQVLGTVEAYDGGSITVDGTTFAISDGTGTLGTPAEGLMVWVFGLRIGDTTAAIFVLVLDEITVTGIVESMSANEIKVDGVSYSLTNRTRVIGNVAVGDEVTIGTNAEANRAGQEALLVREANAAPTAVSLASPAATVSYVSVALLTLAVVVMAAATRFVLKRD